MKVYAGIDLHSSNNYTAVIDDQDKRLYGKKLPNRLSDVLSALEDEVMSSAKSDTIH